MMYTQDVTAYGFVWGNWCGAVGAMTGNVFPLCTQT